MIQDGGKDSWNGSPNTSHHYVMEMLYSVWVIDFAILCLPADEPSAPNACS